MNTIQEFRMKPGKFYQKTRRRVVREMLVLVLLAACMNFPWFSWISLWQRWTFIGAAVCYIGVGLLMYPQTKAIAETFSISVLEDALYFFRREVQKATAL